jgi:TrmH family RNA methyltransferase
MLSKKELQLVNSLKQKKYREEYQLFVAEGVKIVSELLKSPVEVKQVFATSKFLSRIEMDNKINCIEVKEGELERLSALTTPNEVLAVCKIPSYTFDKNELKGKLTLVLDMIKDPGNLGTIIRIADWFGIDTIICSNESADAFNPKVVQATMGSIARIKLHYLHLPDFFEGLKNEDHPGIQLQVYGALLGGENIYTRQLASEGIVVIGNESKGISESVLPYITQAISIPSFSHTKSGKGEAESLNAAIATAIVCSEFRRKTVH